MIGPGSLVRIMHGAWWVEELEEHMDLPGARLRWHSDPPDSPILPRWAPLGAMVEITPEGICRQDGCLCKLLHPSTYGLPADVLSPGVIVEPGP